MDDIRPVLRNRLLAIARERARLDELEAGIKRLLALEEGASTGTQTNGNGPQGAEVTVLAHFVLDALKHAKHPLTVNDLKSAAEESGIDFGKKSPGRVLHWALVGKKRSGLVEKVNGKWRLTEPGQFALKEAGQ